MSSNDRRRAFRFGIYAILIGIGVHVALRWVPQTIYAAGIVQVLVACASLGTLIGVLIFDYRNGGTLMSRRQEEKLLMFVIGLFWLSMAIAFRIFRARQAGGGAGMYHEMEHTYGGAHERIPRVHSMEWKGQKNRAQHTQHTQHNQNNHRRNKHNKHSRAPTPQTPRRITTNSRTSHASRAKADTVLWRRSRIIGGRGRADSRRRRTPGTPQKSGHEGAGVG
ncbi:hypothetical protein BOTBODRAFT_326071 [Botryobasidium botryosum FD-172 SS1]|uniref:Uncharacterized protein n=1 Tax=Botryobasidium botryosum (strain FD-172 SS1) TaxID=930990 RepID=A0A067N235_BOTB1|nr:hypothetical protein BOTBODRAFT_326071 [Botryobasidium botryosum FD-172 SS1]